MNNFWETTLWQQLGAAIDMLDHAVSACPEDLWDDRSRQPAPDGRRGSALGGQGGASDL